MNTNAVKRRKGTKGVRRFLKRRKYSVPAHKDLKPHFDELLAVLQTINTKKQARNKNRKTVNAEWLIYAGRTTNALGGKSFETPHEFLPSVGVYVNDIEKSSKPKAVKAAYKKAMEILRMFAPTYAGTETKDFVVVQFMKLRNSSNYFKAHTDSKDIDVQYLFSLGQATCDTVIYDKNDKERKRVQYHERIFCMDGRFKHKLDTSTLHGTRYSVVYFKLSDPRYKRPAKLRPRSFYLSGEPERESKT